MLFRKEVKAEACFFFTLLSCFSGFNLYSGLGVPSFKRRCHALKMREILLALEKNKHGVRF